MEIQRQLNELTKKHEEKLKMIAPFEIEQMLPFSLSDCSIDTMLVSKVDKKIIEEKKLLISISLLRILLLCVC